jgi:hypothetical protein
MSSNTIGGSYRTNPAKKMRAFDKLPPATRAALANGVEDWVPQPLLTKCRHRELGWTDEELASLVRWWDATELAQRAKQRARGTGPYKGSHPDQQSLKPERERRP